MTKGASYGPFFFGKIMKIRNIFLLAALFAIALAQHGGAVETTEGKQQVNLLQL